MIRSHIKVIGLKMFCETELYLFHFEGRYRAGRK